MEVRISIKTENGRSFVAMIELPSSIKELPAVAVSPTEWVNINIGDQITILEICEDNDEDDEEPLVCDSLCPHWHND